MVKCTNCGHRWRAQQDRAAEGQDDGEPKLPETPVEDDLEFVPAEAPEPAPAPAKAAKPAPEKPPSRLPLILAGTLAVVVLLGGATVLLRQQIAGVIPGTAPLFSAIGLPVNMIGLVVEGVKTKPLLQGGRPVLSVTGAVRNVRDEPLAAPPIRITLRDKAGVELATLLADPMSARVPPGGVRYFAIAMPDPPAGAAEIEIGFEVSGHESPKGAHAAPPVTTQPVAAGPEPMEAQPLPPGSPDALHPPESHESH